MLKNKLYIIGVTILLGLIGLVACQEDPEFPDPGFELSDKSVEIRRDTINTYHVEFKMSVPNGVDKIEVLNGNDYSLIEQVDEYNGKTNFLFMYDIDLTSIEKDTILNYIFRAVDNYDRSVNKGLQLSVKRKSTPEVKVVGGENVALSLPAYLAKALVTTGLAPIETITIRYEGNEIETITIPADTSVYEYKLKEQVIVGLLEENREYNLEIEVNDKGINFTTAKGEVITREPISYTKNITITKGAETRQIPSMITYTDGYSGYPTRFLLYANGDLKVDSMTTQRYSSFNRDFYDPDPAIIFSYNAEDMIDTIKHTRYDYKTVLTYLAGTNQLDKIEEWADINATPDDVLPGDISLLASNFSYNELNQMVSYFYEPSSYMVNDLRYVDPFGIGQYVSIEQCLDAPALAAQASGRPYFDTFAPVFAPAYMPGLPACVELSGGTIFEDAIKILCSNPYQPLELKNSNGTITQEFTYTTDEQGRIVVMSWEQTKWSRQYTYTYTFSYD